VFKPSKELRAMVADLEPLPEGHRHADIPHSEEFE
jgi:hypothetical protein